MDGIPIRRPTDISITTTMIRDMTSQSTEGTQPTDVMQGRVSVVVTTPEVFNDDHEMVEERLVMVIHVLC